MKHKKIEKPENKIKRKRAEKLKSKIKEYKRELNNLQTEIDDLIIKRIEIRININKLELNLKNL